jgi:hypothetical protein
MKTSFAATMRSTKRSSTYGTLVAVWIPTSFAAAVRFTQDSRANSTLVTAAWMPTSLATTMGAAE